MNTIAPASDRGGPAVVGNVACASILVADDAPRFSLQGAVMPATGADTVPLPRVPDLDPTAADGLSIC